MRLGVPRRRFVRSVASDLFYMRVNGIWWRWKEMTMKYCKCLSEMNDVMSSGLLDTVIWWCPDCGTVLKIKDGLPQQITVYETKQRWWSGCRMADDK